MLNGSAYSGGVSLHCGGSNRCQHSKENCDIASCPARSTGWSIVRLQTCIKKVASGPMAGRVLRRGSVRTATGMVIYRTAKAAPYYKQSRTFRRYSKYKTAKRTVKTYKRRRADQRRREFSKRYRAVSPSGYVYYYYRKRRKKS